MQQIKIISTQLIMMMVLFIIFINYMIRELFESGKWKYFVRYKSSDSIIVDPEKVAGSNINSVEKWEYSTSTASRSPPGMISRYSYIETEPGCTDFVSLIDPPFIE